MLTTIQNFPEQFLIGHRLVEAIDLGALRGKSFRRIFFAGMGGSSLPGDLVNDFLSDERPLRPVRDYRLPHDIRPEDLVIASSYSGNTEETLEALDSALEKKAATIALTHGGKLAQLAREKNLPLISIPECIQPRCATGYFFASLLGILHRLGKMEDPRPSL